jgi:hypothetical protein
VDPGDGLVHAMQGYQGQQGGNGPPLRRPCGGRRKMAILQDSLMWLYSAGHTETRNLRSLRGVFDEPTPDEKISR